MNEEQAKEILSEEFETLKKSSKDVSNLIQSTVHFRTSIMVSYENGLRYIAEIKKLGDHYRNNKFCDRILQLANDHENIESARYELQTKIWDNCILHLLNGSEADMKDLQNLEKKIKHLESELSKRDKKLKKGENVEILPYKYEDLVDYVKTYRDHRLHKWLKLLGAEAEAEKDFSKNTLEIWKKESWRAVNNPDPLPDLAQVIAGTASPRAPRRQTYLKPPPPIPTENKIKMDNIIQNNENNSSSILPPQPTNSDVMNQKKTVSSIEENLINTTPSKETNILSTPSKKQVIEKISNQKNSNPSEKVHINPTLSEEKHINVIANEDKSDPDIVVSNEDNQIATEEKIIDTNSNEEKLHKDSSLESSYILYIKTGFMETKSISKKKYWFALSREGTLASYKNEVGAEPNKIINLKECGELSLEQKKLTFSFKNPTKSYSFICSNQSDFESWIEKISPFLS